MIDRNAAIALFAMALTGLPAGVFSAESVNDAELALERDVLVAAKEGLRFFLNGISEGREGDYGFPARAELAIAQVGTPFRMFTIASEHLSNEQTSVKDILEPLDEWRVPILVQGEFRSLLTVGKMKGVWRAVEIGGAVLASELGHFEKMTTASSPNAKRALLRIYPFRSDFLMVAPAGGQLSEGEIYPLQSARLYLDLGTTIKVDFGQLRGILARKQAATAIESR